MSPIGKENVKTCRCCGMVTISDDFIFLCVKCKIDDHTGLASCERCKELKEFKNFTKDEK